MWTVTAYVLDRYFSKLSKKQVSLADLRGIFFDQLWREKRLIFHDSTRDILTDLNYLQHLGVVKVSAVDEDSTSDKILVTLKKGGALKQLSGRIKRDFQKSNLEIYQDYLRAIDNAIR